MESSAKDKRVYIVRYYKVLKYAINILTPSITFIEYTKEVTKFIESELINLKLLDKHDLKNQDPNNPLYKQYFMHGISHHLGLDVHDLGTYKTIKPGMVITVEPGIYITQENIGIRLEDNVIIHNSYTENITNEIPIEIEDIEYIMNA